MKTTQVNKYIEQAQEEADAWAQQEIENIRLGLEGLTPEEQNRELQKKRDFWIDQRNQSRNYVYDVLKPVEENVNSLMFYYNQIGYKIVSLAGAGEAIEEASPSLVIKATVSPALRAKRILELLNDIDKQPVCSVIPRALLSDVFKTFNKYLDYNSEEEFIKSVYSDKLIKYIGNTKSNLCSIFSEALRRIKGKKSVNFEQTKVVSTLFEGMPNKEIPIGSKPMHKEIDLFFNQFDVKKYVE